MSEIDETYFNGKTWLIYGRLPNIAKADSTSAIVSRGGRVIKSVSAKLDFLVTSGPTPEPGKEEGVKAQQAAAVGALVIGEPDFLLLIDGVDPFSKDEASLDALPEELARIHYPGEDVDIDATYFEGKAWFSQGGFRVPGGSRKGKDVMRRMLGARGGKLVRAIEDADFVQCENDTPLWGEHLPPVLQEARDRGTPIFGAHDLALLLAGERPTPPEDDSVGDGEAFGEIRALVQSPDDTLTHWWQLQELLGGLSGGALEGAVEYLSEHIDRLEPAHRVSAAMGGSDPWMARTLTGKGGPELSLIRAIRVDDAINTAQSEALFAAPHLTNVESYSLSPSKAAPQKHWSLLADAAHWDKLASLRVSRQTFGKKAAKQLRESGRFDGVSALTLTSCTFKKGAAAELFGPGAFPALAYLDLDYTSAEDDGLFEAVAARGFTGLKHLEFDGRYVDAGVATLLSGDTSASLESLSIKQITDRELDAMLAGPALEGLDSLTLTFATGTDCALWRDPRIANLKHLKLALHDADGDFLEWLVSESPLAPNLERLELRAWELDWTKHLSGANMPALRHVHLDMPGKTPFALDEVFPALETSEHTQWDGHWHKEFEYRK